MTMCNMAIEGGARAGMVAPDDVTFEYLKGRPMAPFGAEFDSAVASWRQLPSDDGATYDKEIVIDAAALAPTLTWGTSPEDACPITASVPDPAQAPNEQAWNPTCLVLARKHALETLAFDHVSQTPHAQPFCSRARLCSPAEMPCSTRTALRARGDSRSPLL